MLLKLQLRTWVTRIAQVLLRDSYTVGARGFFLGGGQTCVDGGPKEPRIIYESGSPNGNRHIRGNMHLTSRRVQSLRPPDVTSSTQLGVTPRRCGLSLPLV